MIHYYEDLIRSVRIRLNQLPDRPSAFKEFTSVALPLDELIASVIEQGVNEIIDEIPPRAYPEPKKFGDGASWVSEHDYLVPLPADFKRLVTFRLTGWERSVDRLIMPDDADYQEMFSKFTMIRGTPSRPRCYYVPDEGRGRLLASSCERDVEKIASALYVPVALQKGNGSERTIDFPSVIRDRVVARVAALTHEIIDNN